MRRWQEEIENRVNNLPDKASVRSEDMSFRKDHVRALCARLATYELLKEATSLLELALWKSKIGESASSVHCHKKAKVGITVSHKEQCRINCGADIMLRNVFPYLCPK